ncbi:hypothetical protein J2T55_002662 [Methylohalomonas lacus]|uniref:Uncharacterized protein n=1 Tax=Methylohalomonas lacus TaxID=398773 RepID=A0AAE3HNI5_9GAMM|nr:hypothetical protein [Methylohalomonas lacus]
MLEEALALSPADRALDDEALMQRPPRVQAAVQAWRYRALLQQLEFAVAIGSGNNDDPSWSQWSDRANVDDHITFHAAMGNECGSAI